MPCESAACAAPWTSWPLLADARRANEDGETALQAPCWALLKAVGGEGLMDLIHLVRLTLIRKIKRAHLLPKETSTNSIETWNISWSVLLMRIVFEEQFTFAMTALEQSPKVMEEHCLHQNLNTVNA